MEGKNLSSQVEGGQKQIIQRHDAQTHKIGNNGVSLAFRLQVIAQESLTVSGSA